ncbi:MAG: radical SAM protein [Bacilli bacterium]|nr:radical SAM protein [Bacilli bacterium]
MYRFNIIITEACNANCTHCYMGNNKSTKTMSKEDIDTIISKVPDNTEKIVLTGGEIFLKKELLLYTIKEIHKHNPKISIELETNGIYLYKGKATAKEKLQKLKELGVTSIRFSDDPFHEMGGVNLERVRALKQLEDESTPILKYLVQEKALAIGKAADLSEEYTENRDCMNNQQTVDNPYFFLDVSGNVYICTWKCIPPIGNMIKEDMDTILERLNEEFNSYILRGEILKAINLVSKDSDNSIFIKEHGECMLCNKIFNK